MKISARNQLKVKIADVKNGAVNSEIFANIGECGKLCAMITLKSANELGLKAGDDAIFIFKAPNVILAKGQKLKISISNQLKIKVSEIKKGAVNTEIIAAQGEHELCAVITNESCDKLGIKKGDEALFLINPSDIIVARA